MTDIHCHILPGVDDGARRPEEAVEMARMAWHSGVDTIIATPHTNLPENGDLNFASSEMLEHFRTFQQLLDQEGIPVRVYPGAEVMFTPEMPDLLEEGMLLTLAGSRYVLVEFYFDVPFYFMDDALHQILDTGYVPVLAHPERYYSVQSDPDMIREWFEQGIIIQVNKGSILGRFGKECEETAEWLLERGFVHIVASDAHRTNARTTDMREVRQVLKEEYSPEYAAILLDENPKRILEDRPMVPVN